VLIATVLTWVLGLWAGWSLVFGGSGSIVEATSRRPAGASDVVYYAGFTIFTLGTGDFVAADPGWRITTAIASFSGLFLITLAITYLISIVSALVNRRALAVQILGLGTSPGDIVANGWSSDRFGNMFQQQLVRSAPTSPPRPSSTPHTRCCTTFTPRPDSWLLRSPWRVSTTP
jgi:hypothetical protein